MLKVVAGAVAVVLVAGTAAAMLKGYGARQYQAGYDARDVEALKVQNKHLADQVERERRSLQITSEISANFARATADIRRDFRSVQKDIPTYVTPETSARYPWPVGAVRLHDAAVARAAVSEFPDPAGRADGDPSDVGAADGISVVLSNYKQCELDRERLRRLQQWNREQAAQ